MFCHFFQKMSMLIQMLFEILQNPSNVIKIIFIHSPLVITENTCIYVFCPNTHLYFETYRKSTRLIFCNLSWIMKIWSSLVFSSLEVSIADAFWKLDYSASFIVVPLFCFKVHTCNEESWYSGNKYPISLIVDKCSELCWILSLFW